MVNFDDEACQSPLEIRRFLGPALPIVKASIPCVVWCGAALSIMFFAPSGYTTLNLIVPDNQLVKAALAIENNGQYKIIDPDEDEWTREKWFINGQKIHFFPHSVTLRHPGFNIAEPIEPYTIRIHPASFWKFDIGDASRVTPLIPSVGKAFDAYRFPTDIALVDSLVETMLEPPLYGGLWVFTLDRTCTRWIRDLMQHYLSNQGDPKTASGEWVPRISKVLDGIREENREYFKYFTHCYGPPKSLKEYAEERARILKRNSERMGIPFRDPVRPICTFPRDPYPVDNLYPPFRIIRKPHWLARVRKFLPKLL